MRLLRAFLSSILTAHSNDYHFDTVFERQVQALCKPEDIVIGLTTSGTSNNINLALEAANEAHLVKVTLAALYTGQRRSDIIKMADTDIENGVWLTKQGKTGTIVPVPLHPVVLAIIEEEREARKKAGIVDPRRPLLTNSRGTPWTATGDRKSVV